MQSRSIVTVSSFAFSEVTSCFPQLLKCDNRYGSVLPCITLLATLLCLTSYEQCSTRLLKMLHKRCNTDMLGDLLIYSHSPSGARNRAYISVKPLAAVLQPINVSCHYMLNQEFRIKEGSSFILNSWLNYICNLARDQTNIQLFGEYLNIRLFDYDFEYSNNCFKGNI